MSMYNKRDGGVSPVIATILILGLVVVLAAIVLPAAYTTMTDFSVQEKKTVGVTVQSVANGEFQVNLMKGKDYAELVSYTVITTGSSGNDEAVYYKQPDGTFEKSSTLPSGTSHVEVVGTFSDGTSEVVYSGKIQEGTVVVSTGYAVYLKYINKDTGKLLIRDNVPPKLQDGDQYTITESDYREKITGYIFTPSKISGTIDGSDVEKTVPCTPIHYWVKFDGNGGNGTMQPREFIYDKSDYLTACDFKKDGYTFAGWMISKDGSNVTYTDKALVNNLCTEQDETITLYAKWQPKGNNLTFDYRNGTTPATVWAENGKKYGDFSEFSIPTRIGYTAAGWYNENTAISASTEVNLEKDTTITLTWTANKYTITLNHNADENGTNGSVTATYGSSSLLNRTDAVRTGAYILGGYYSSSDDTGKLVISSTGQLQSNVAGYTDIYGNWIKAENTVLYAKWKTGDYYLTFDFNDGVTKPDTVKATNGLTYGEHIQWDKMPARTGYVVEGWFIGDKAISVDDVVNLDKDTTVTLRWTPKTYNILLVDNAGYKGVSDGKITVTYDSGSTSNYAAAERTGKYVIDGYYTTSDASLGEKVIDSSGKIVSGTVSGYVSNGTWTKDGQSLVLYAQWTGQDITLTYHRNESTIQYTNVDDPNSLRFELSDDASYKSASTYQQKGKAGLNVLNPSKYNVMDIIYQTSDGDDVLAKAYFSGWIDANSVFYPDEVSGEFDDDMDFYAVWSLYLYKIILKDERNNTEKSVSVDRMTESPQPVDFPKLPVPANAGTDGIEFQGWYYKLGESGEVQVTDKDGTPTNNLRLDSTTTTPDTSNAMMYNVELKAKWNSVYYVDLYDSDKVTLLGSFPVTVGTKFTLPNGDAYYNADGKVLTGWKDASGNEYSYGVAYDGPAAAGTRLAFYAKWDNAKASLVLNMNYPVGTNPSPVTWEIVADVPYSVDSLTLEMVRSKPGNSGFVAPGTAYMFTGWYDAKDGGSKISSVTLDDKETKQLYAHWSKLYQVKYIWNGANAPHLAEKPNDGSTTVTGNTSMSLENNLQKFTEGTGSALSENRFTVNGVYLWTKATEQRYIYLIFITIPYTYTYYNGVSMDYAFTGWNTKSDGSGTSYADKASMNLSSSQIDSLPKENGIPTLTLYAQWKGPEVKVTFNSVIKSGWLFSSYTEYSKTLYLPTGTTLNSISNAAVTGNVSAGSSATVGDVSKWYTYRSSSTNIQKYSYSSQYQNSTVLTNNLVLYGKNW